MKPAREYFRGERGVTLIEMLLVMAIMALMVGITFPSVASGLDSIRLRTATDSTVSFLHLGMTYAERRQQTIELSMTRSTGRLTLRSVTPGFQRDMTLPEGVRINHVDPVFSDPPPDRIVVFLYPDGAFPRISIELANRREQRRVVRIDPVAGTPVVDAVP